MRPRHGRTVAAIALAVALPACQASDRRPNPAGKTVEPPGQIAFSFGKRLHLMRADGSGVRRLTGGRFGRRDGGDTQPAWSPDGARIAYVKEPRWVPGRRADIRGRPPRWPPPRDNRSPARRIQSLEPAWSPDGSRIAYTRWSSEDGRLESAIMVVEVDGSGRRVLQREPPGRRVWRSSARRRGPLTERRILYTRTALDRRYRFRPALYTMDAEGGGARLLAADAGSGAWSPDGSRIAFASVRDRNGIWCGSDECSYNAELYVMDADGTDLERLTHSRGNEGSPSWSPDGRRIAFAGNRNTRDQPPGSGTEIYSIGAGGACLTWLTNGSPDSDDPAWRPGSAGPSGPGRCGATRRPPRVELDLRGINPSRNSPAYWLGRRYGDVLLGGVDAYRTGRSLRSYFFYYDDCARYLVGACPRGLQIQVESVCTGRTTASGIDQHNYQASVRDGRLLIDIGQGDLSLITGSMQVRIFPEAGPGARRPQLLAAFRDLRRVGAPRRALPPPALPRELLRGLARARLLYDRTGSAERTAQRLGISAERVRQRLQLARTLDSLPRVSAISCPRR